MQNEATHSRLYFPQTWNKLHQKCLFLLFPHVLVSFLQSAASSYKQNQTSQKIPCFALIVEGLHQCFLFLLFMFFPPLFRVKPLHYISWLIGHEGTGSILSVLRKKWVLLPLSVCFSDSRALQKKTQLKGLQFAGYTWAFSSSERKARVSEPNLQTIHFASPLDDVIHTFSSHRGCGYTRAFQPLVAKWQSDATNPLWSHNTKKPSNSPFTISTTWSVW